MTSTTRNAFVVTSLFAVGFFFWLFIYQMFVSSKAGSIPKLKVTFDKTKTDVQAGSEVKVNVFLSGNASDKISGVTSVISYPSKLIEYVSTLQSLEENMTNQTEKTCVVNGYKLNRVLNVKNDTDKGLLTITRVAIAKDDELPSGVFCLGTITFKARHDITSSERGVLNFSQLNEWEMVGPNGSYQPLLDNSNSQLQLNIIP